VKGLHIAFHFILKLISIVNNHNHYDKACGGVDDNMIKILLLLILIIIIAKQRRRRQQQQQQQQQLPITLFNSYLIVVIPEL
jgi:hypothetical protein